MPYITFSRKLAAKEETALQRSIGSGAAYKGSVVERRGTKSIRKVMQRALRLGFTEVIIIERQVMDEKGKGKVASANVFRILKIGGTSVNPKILQDKETRGSVSA